MFTLELTRSNTEICRRTVRYTIYLAGTLHHAAVVYVINILLRDKERAYAGGRGFFQGVSSENTRFRGGKVLCLCTTARAVLDAAA